MDSLALHTGIKAIGQANPDAVELLPGIIPRVVEYVATQVKKPVITGGMIISKVDVLEALKREAVAVSTSCKELWNTLIRKVVLQKKKEVKCLKKIDAVFGTMIKILKQKKGRPRNYQLIRRIYGYADVYFFGNGVVANTCLRKSKAEGAGWVNITIG